MPPRIPISRAVTCCRTAALQTGQLAPSSSPLVSLFAALSIQQPSQTRPSSILANLRHNKDATSNRKRVGRGPSSGFGKTSGRGQKGAKARSKVHPFFQGGQTLLLKSHGRKGFVNHRALNMSTVNLDRLQEFINAGRIDATKQITPKELIRSGLLGSAKDGVKILARGKSDLTTPVDLLVSRASASAIETIENAGGKVVTRYFTRQSIKGMLQGKIIASSTPLPVGPEFVEAELERKRKNPHMRRLPDPTSREDIEYYRDPAHRGYLSHQLQPGESPSLYFKVPTERKLLHDPEQKVRKQKTDDNRLF